ITVNNGNQYTRSTQVTLSLSATDNVGVVDMAFSDDGSQFGAYVAYATAALYTVPAGDGIKTVYTRSRDAAGNVSTLVNDGILLDTVSPSAPTGLTADRASNDKSTELQWNAFAASDLAGYAVFRRTGISGSTFVQVTCAFTYGSPTKCLDSSEDNHTSYT